MSDQIEAMQRKTEVRKKAAFEKWLDEPMVRMGISMIPAGERADALRMLLQSAFESGCNCGAGDVTVQMLESVMLARRSDDRR